MLNTIVTNFKKSQQKAILKILKMTLTVAASTETTISSNHGVAAHDQSQIRPSVESRLSPNTAFHLCPHIWGCSQIEVPGMQPGDMGCILTATECFAGLYWVNVSISDVIGSPSKGEPSPPPPSLEMTSSLLQCAFLRAECCERALSFAQAVKADVQGRPPLLLLLPTSHQQTIENADDLTKTGSNSLWQWSKALIVH